MSETNSSNANSRRSRRGSAIAASLVLAGVGGAVASHHLRAEKSARARALMTEVRGSKSETPQALRKILSAHEIDQLRNIRGLTEDQISQMTGEQLFAEASDIQEVSLDLSDATGVSAEEVKDMLLSQPVEGALLDRRITFEPAPANECLNGSGRLDANGHLISANFPLSNQPE